MPIFLAEGLLVFKEMNTISASQIALVKQALHSFGYSSSISKSTFQKQVITNFIFRAMRQCFGLEKYKNLLGIKKIGVTASPVISKYDHIVYDN